jgi:protein kinase-like protein
MTAAGTTVGTAAYMAPEQATGHDVSARADIWAFGVTLYEMLTGRLPFDGKTAPAILLAVTSQAPAPIRDVRPEVPEALARIVERALDKDPARRTISADDIAAEIGNWRTKSSTATIAAASVRRSTAKWWIAIAAVALLAAAVPGAWFIRQNARTRWAREQALPQIDQLAEAEKYGAAFALAQQAKRYIASDPVWKRIDPSSRAESPSRLRLRALPSRIGRWAQPAAECDSASPRLWKRSCRTPTSSGGSKRPATSRHPTRRPSSSARRA